MRPYGGRSTRKRHLGPFAATLGCTWDVGSFNRPQVKVDRYDVDELGFVVSWGNGSSDPLWCLYVTVNLPGWWPGVAEGRRRLAALEGLVAEGYTLEEALEMERR